MIISHEHRFIFVKRAKTAGTSIEVLLSPLCGPDDVLTPLDPPEDRHQPRNYDDLQKQVETSVSSQWRSAIDATFLEHLPAWFLSDHLPDLWGAYFSFCIERNPWDKLVSAYRYYSVQPNVDPNLSFRAFLPLGLELYGNFRDYSDDNGRIIVDRVLRYERLDTELTDVFALLGIPFAGELRVRTKGGYRPAGDDYRTYYDRDTRNLVANRYAREIDEFGYQF